jgi:integrase
VIGCAINVLAPFWQGRTVGEVTKQTCKFYGKERARAPNTVRRELSVLRAAINFAYEEGTITRPVHVELPEPPASRKRWLTRDEAARLVRASRTPSARLYLPLFILLGIYTGRRKEAILSLRWSQVDLAAGLIDFETPGRKQTSKRRGAVRLPPRLLPHLRRARLRGTEIGYVLHRNGQRILDVKKGFGAACERAGLERATPHTLRHTADAARHSDLGGGGVSSNVRKDAAGRVRSSPSRFPKRSGREHRQPSKTGLRIVRGMSA